ncbi:MAG TPA: PAS domain-containing sensor histidine kinase [Myxococcaceae bacterium]|nr:PAS domain-containing sensor histidine kinase [Myxococcaceae bacterium]
MTSSTAALRVDDTPPTITTPTPAMKERELIRLAVDVVQENVYLLDRNIRYVYVNQLGAAAMGLAPAQMIGRTMDEVFGAGSFPEFRIQVQAAFVTGAPARSEIAFLSGDETRWYEYSLSPIPVPEGPPQLVTCVSRDVTQRRRVEKEAALGRAAVEEERRKLQAAAEFEQRLLGIVSHDLRNPLASVRLGLETMRRRGITEDHLRTIERMERSTDRMQAIISSLLDVTRIRHGHGLPLTPEVVALDAVVTRVLEGMPEDQVRRVRRETEGRPTGVWDPERLAQAIGNLVGNALQHGDAERPVTVRVRGGERRAELSVHNHGSPIPPELLPGLFEPFQRGLRPGALDGSIGLGLYIVRQVAVGHGGEVRVLSTAEEGTTFVVELPADGAPAGRDAAAGR